MIVGCLGDKIIFEVSEETIMTVEKIDWSGSVRITEHKRHLTNALTEFTGIDADKLSLPIKIASYLGKDVQGVLAEIWVSERAGKPMPLVLGTKVYGKFAWMISSHKINIDRFDAAGNAMSADVTLNLIEYLKQ